MESEIPTKEELIRFLKRVWRWKGSPKMFDMAAESYQEAIRNGTWAYENGKLVEVGIE